MRARSGIILFVLGLAVLAAGWAFGPGSVATERMTIARGTLMFPGLPARLADAARIEIAKGTKRLTLMRTGSGKDAAWGVAQHDGYKVLPAKVHALLTSLAELRLLEPRTSNPTLYARLGLADPAKPSGAGAADQATTVRVLGADGKAIVAVDLGRHHATQRPGSGDSVATLYVRRPEQARTWLAAGNIDVDPDAQDWLDRDIMNVEGPRVVQVTTTRGAATIDLARTGGRPDAPLSVLRPDPHPPVDDSKLDETARALELLSFDDVRKAAAHVPVVATTVYRLRSGMAVTVTLLGEDKDAWSHFTVSGPGSEALAKVVDGWDYRLGNYKNDLLAPTFTTLKPPPTPVTTSGDQLQGLIHPGAPALPPGLTMPDGH